MHDRDVRGRRCLCTAWKNRPTPNAMRSPCGENAGASALRSGSPNTTVVARAVCSEQQNAVAQARSFLIVDGEPLAGRRVRRKHAGAHEPELGVAARPRHARGGQRSPRRRGGTACRPSARPARAPELAAQPGRATPENSMPPSGPPLTYPMRPSASQRGDHFSPAPRRKRAMLAGRDVDARDLSGRTQP